MAFSLKITSARQCAMGLAPQAGVPGTYNVVVDYCVQAAIGAQGAVQDVLLGGAQQRVSAPVQAGKPMLTPAQVAVLIRQDCQEVFGGQPDTILIDQKAY